MKSDYKRLGDFIDKIDVRNKNSQNTKLLGLSVTKEFRPHASNIIGTDLSRYKVVNQWQFACDFMSTIRVRKLPVVLQVDDEKIIVSPAYTTFKVLDPNKLNPQYLMMWFRREEFDRYAYFSCDSAVRGGFNWEELCDVKLPVPSIEKQYEIVKEYNTIVDRINLNEQLNQKLEETAQTIYKHWFIDFEFPNENGQPYKSSGEKMVYNEQLDKDIPEGWGANRIVDFDILVTDFVANGSFKSLADNVTYLTETGYAKLIRLTDYKKNYLNNGVHISKESYDFLKKSRLEGGEIIIANVGINVGTVFRCPKLKIKMSLAPNSIMVKSRKYENYLYSFFTSFDGQKELSEIVGGSAQPKFNKTNFRKITVTVPSNTLIEKFNAIIDLSFKHQTILLNEIRQLVGLKKLILTKLVYQEKTIQHEV